MDYLSIIMSIIGIVATYGILNLIANPNLSWKLVLLISFILSVVLGGLYIISVKVNTIHTFLIYNQLYLYIALSIGFLISGAFSLKKSVNNKSIEGNETVAEKSSYKKLLYPITIFLLLFIPFSIFQTVNLSIEFYYIIPVIIIFSLLNNLILIYFQVFREILFNWEFLGIVSMGAGAYIFFSLLLPGNYASEFQLFAPDNAGVETIYLILTAVVFVIVFLAGFFTPRKNSLKNKKRT